MQHLTRQNRIFQAAIGVPGIFGNFVVQSTRRKPAISENPPGQDKAHETHGPVTETPEPHHFVAHCRRNFRHSKEKLAPGTDPTPATLATNRTDSKVFSIANCQWQGWMAHATDPKNTPSLREIRQTLNTRDYLGKFTYSEIRRLRRMIRCLIRFPVAGCCSTR